MDMSKPEQLPNDVESERALIGCCLNEMKHATTVRSRYGIEHDSFYRLDHQHLWTALLDLEQSSGKADLQQIRRMLKERGHWEGLGGDSVNELIEFCEQGQFAWNAEYHASVVADYAARREVMRHSREIARCAMKDGSDIQSVTDRLEAIMKSVQKAQGTTANSFADALEEAEAYMEAVNEGRLDTVKTGIKPLDEHIRGFVPGELVVVAGRPSSGKTALACVIAYHLAKNDDGVSFFSAESTRREIATRIMRIATGVDYATIEEGQFTATKYEKWKKWRERLKDSAIQIDDTSRIYIEHLYGTALEHVRQRGSRAIVIDHVQRIQTHKNARRHQELEYITDRCKVLAREANVPVILLSQLNRKSEGSPSLPKSCGAIEEIADTMIFLRYDAAYDDPDANEDVHAERMLDVTKKREGPTGKVPVIFKKDVLQFVADGEYDQSPDMPNEKMKCRDVSPDEGVPF